MRALVLGGGGSTGNAWLIGVVAGLAEAGVDVTGADLFVGTSAGSTAAAQLTGADAADLYVRTLEPVPPHRAAGARPVGSLDRTRGVIAAASSAADMRRRMGAAALAAAAASNGARREQWRTTVAARLPSQDWPRPRVLITAVDADSGEGVAFDRDSGVGLADAIAASCSSGVAYSIGERHYIDGGYRRNENADLARGSERVLVLSPFGGRSLHPPEWRMHLAAQLEELEASGSAVETIFPASEDLFGANAMDLALRPAAARAGHERGVELAERIGAFWG